MFRFTGKRPLRMTVLRIEEVSGDDEEQRHGETAECQQPFLVHNSHIELHTCEDYQYQSGQGMEGIVLSFGGARFIHHIA